MIQTKVTIVNKLGLHARAAAKLVGLANKYESEVWIGKDGQEVNGKSILGLHFLAAGVDADDGPDRVATERVIDDRGVGRVAPHGRDVLGPQALDPPPVVGHHEHGLPALGQRLRYREAQRTTPQHEPPRHTSPITVSPLKPRRTRRGRGTTYTYPVTNPSAVAARSGSVPYRPRARPEAERMSGVIGPTLLSDPVTRYLVRGFP